MNSALNELTSVFKAVADPTRLRLLALCARGECSVSDLTTVLGQSQPRVSRHLRILSDAGLVARFRDGHYVYYRLPLRGDGAARARSLLAMLPDDSGTLDGDHRRLVAASTGSAPLSPAEGAFNRALLDFAMASSIGRVLDIGVGSAQTLALLAPNASELIGIDIDAAARRGARERLRSVGLANCSIRAGNMYRLEFADDAFDTVILDDVLTAADRPAAVLAEASRVLGERGRMLIIDSLADPAGRAEHTAKLARLALRTGLRVSAPRAVPADKPQWLFCTAVPVDQSNQAA